MKKRKMVTYRRYIVSLVCMALLAGGAGAVTYNYFGHQVETSAGSEGLAKVQKLYDEITKNYVGEVDQNKLIDGALKGMTEALDDPYSSYLDESATKALNDSLSGSFEGIGAVLSIKDNYPIVAQEPVKDSPAAKAGLKINDRVIKVDNKSTEGVDLSEVVAQIRGEKGTTVTLTIQRDKETFDVSIKRETVPIETVRAELAQQDSSVGYIQISSFSETTFKELKTAISSLRKEGAKAFVIDVRNNPGGLLDQAEKMSSMFLKDGKTIVQFKDKKGSVSKDVASSELDGGFKVTEPVAVLIDENSASAAEIFAAALNESAKIPTIGTKTYGKGTVQTVKNLQNNSEIKLTVLKWLTPSGKWIHKKGLVPEIEADYPEYAYLQGISRDEVLTEGQHSEAVQNLNSLLSALGYPVEKATETFTAETKAAVQDIQSKNQLPVTGEVNDETASQIETLINKLISENDEAYNRGIKEVQNK
jgi:carboxyl-terminal processing protease